MGIRGNMWVKDSQNADVYGKCRIRGREDSIEVLSLGHCITIPTDSKTGKIIGNRSHEPITIIKEIDQSTPFFNKACCTGECLKEVTICLFHINDHGREEKYFQYKLTNARVIGVQPLIGGTEYENKPDRESLAIIYEKIEWQHMEGNYAYSDTWLQRG